ncbi:uncharacterized protein LOC130800455 [Amaranthus tricolor]|uniref:uncharacterized protein LOC130800455 n=1 Tax=Amaranthus tricolor TaxID=29722 RepID=UPI002588534A|nr:uncharacterized protein LOC130800455 [Amaranthus tricolor]
MVMGMALRNAAMAKRLKEVMPLLGRSNRTITTSTPKTNSYAPTLEPEEANLRVSHSNPKNRKSLKEELLPKGKPISDYVPVYVALGMIGVSLSLGLYTAKQELLHSPQVFVKKSRRETIPEVVEPEDVAHHSQDFVNKSLFRKVAHIQEGKTPIIQSLQGNTLTREHRVESLKTVGVDSV